MKGNRNGPLVVYTDGSCKSSGTGGWAAIIKCNKSITELCGGELNTTNNRMELTAVIAALRSVSSPSQITVYTDSQYIVKSINNHWLETWTNNNWVKEDGDTVKNSDLWKDLIELMNKHDVSFIWIPGHSGDPMNERCDKLAKEQSKARSDRR